jgi:SAM-dependent methyltransferase
MGMPTARKLIDLYDTSYKAQFDPAHQEVREETYGLDLGQTSWMTAEELEEFIRLLVLTDSSHVLEVGCGAGGCAVHIAQKVGAKVTGIDVNEHGIASAKDLAGRHKVTSIVDFHTVDGSRDLPFGDESFDAVFSNDAMCHIPERAQVLREWWRVLKPGGRMLFTDAMIVTGILSNEELAVRSAVGYYLFLPPGENERLIGGAGFELLQAIDLTGAVAAVASR